MNDVKMLVGENIILQNINEFRLGKRALIVTGKNSAKKSGALDDVTRALKQVDISYNIYDDITQNPLLSSCLKAGSDNSDADFVIGIGGGSPLDAAKAIAVIVANPDLNEESFYKKEWANKPKPIILVGSSAGTGSEVTKVSVLTDSKHKKHSIHDDLLYAKVAFGDPRYTYSLSYDFTLSTGLDALAHATESYLSNKANDGSRAYSLKAINLLFNNLENLNTKELSPILRKDLYEGSILAGYAIDITGTTFCHNVGYHFTENYNLPHGIASYMFINDLIEFETKNNPEYINQFFKDINIEKERFMKLEELLPPIDIKLSQEEIENILPRWIENGTVKNTYGKIGVDDIKEILIKHFI